MPDQVIFHSKKKTARLLDVSPRTVDTLIATGELKCRRIGRRVLIHHRTLEQFARRDHATRPKKRTSGGIMNRRAKAQGAADERK